MDKRVVLEGSIQRIAVAFPRRARVRWCAQYAFANTTRPSDGIPVTMHFPFSFARLSGMQGDGRLFSRLLHHCFKLLGTQKQPVRVAWKLLEVPLLIECLGGVADAIENHGDEGESLAGFVAVAQGLG